MPGAFREVAAMQRNLGLKKWTLALAILLIAGLFWPTPAPAAVPALAVGAAELKAELVNKVMEDWGGMGFPTGQVELTYPDGRTQLLPYRSHLQPVEADGKVYIFVTEGGEVNSIMIYDRRQRPGAISTRCLTIWTRISAPQLLLPTAPGGLLLSPGCPPGVRVHRSDRQDSHPFAVPLVRAGEVFRGACRGCCQMEIWLY
jgi:hypothetical protein